MILYDYMEVSMNKGSPQWRLVMEHPNILFEWMSWGTPILGNLHVNEVILKILEINREQYRNGAGTNKELGDQTQQVREWDGIGVSYCIAWYRIV